MSSSDAVLTHTSIINFIVAVVMASIMAAAYALTVTSEKTEIIPPLSTKPSARERAQGIVRIGSTTVLRFATERDGAKFIDMLTRSHDHLLPWMPRPARGNEPTFGNRFARMLRPDAESLGQVRLLICARDTDRMLGACSLGGISDWPSLQCHVGYWLAHDAIGHGFMRDALSAMLDHAFETRGLHRVSANIIAHNRRSNSLVKALGFSKEGIARGLIEIDGAWRDHQVWSMLASEWRDGSLDQTSAVPKSRKSAR